MEMQIKVDGSFYKEQEKVTSAALLERNTMHYILLPS